MIDTNKNKEGDAESGATEPLLVNEAKNDGPSTTTMSAQPLSAFNYFLFVLVGMGVSWTMVDGIWLQVPYFQRFQPEGASIAVYLSISISVNILVFVPLYVYVEPKLNYRWFMYSMFALEIICCIIATLWWHTAVDSSVSIVLYIVTFTSAAVGNVFFILVLSYFTKINNYTCAPLQVGNTAASAFTSFYAMVQQPGSANALFGPDIFYIILLCSLLLPGLIAYVLLDNGYLKEHRTRDIEAEEDDTEWTCGIPSWWRSIWQYVALHSYLCSVFWVIILAQIPYTMLSTSKNDDMDTESEQYAYCLMYVGMVVGSVIVTFYRVSGELAIWMMAAAVSAMFAVFLWITFDDSGLWKWEGANIFVMVLLFWMGVIYGVVIPTLMINIDEKYPTHSLKMNQWMGMVGVGSMLFFVWISYFVIAD